MGERLRGVYFRWWLQEIVEAPRAHAIMLNVLRLGERAGRDPKFTSLIKQAPPDLSSVMQQHQQQEIAHEALLVKLLHTLAWSEEHDRAIDFVSHLNDVLEAHARERRDVPGVLEFFLLASLLEVNYAAFLQAYFQVLSRYRHAPYSLIHKTISQLVRDEHHHVDYTAYALERYQKEYDIPRLQRRYRTYIQKARVRWLCALLPRLTSHVKSVRFLVLIVVLNAYIRFTH